MAKKYQKFQDYLVKKLHNKKEAKAFLEVAILSFEEDQDVEAFRLALRYLAEAIDKWEDAETVISQGNKRAISDIPLIRDTDCPECLYLKMRKICLIHMLDPDVILNKPLGRESEEVEILRDAINRTLDAVAAYPNHPMTASEVILRNAIVGNRKRKNIEGEKP